MRLLVGLLRRGRVLGAWIRLARIEGQPSAVLYDAKGRVVNPGKLGHIGPVSDVARLPPAENAQFRAPKYGHPANGDPVQNGGGARPRRDRVRACSVGVRGRLAGRGGVQELHGLGQEVGH
jgi:hypothetical protein